MPLREPCLVGKHRRQFPSAKLQHQKREGATEQRRVQEIIENMRRAKPKRRSRGKLDVAAAAPATGKKDRRYAEHGEPNCEVTANVGYRHSIERGENKKA